MNLSRFRTLPALGCLALLALSAGRADAATVLLADGRQMTDVELRAGTTPAQVVLERLGEAAVTVSRDEILIVDYNKTPGRPPLPSVQLLNGDQFVGKVSFPAANQVKIAAGWGVITVPFSSVSVIRYAEKASLPKPGAQDAVHLTNGDRVEGKIGGIQNNQVSLQVAGAKVPVDLKRVNAITFGKREVEAPRSLVVALDLGGGERLTGKWLGMDQDVIKVQALWNAPVEVPVASLSRLEVKNGKLVYLSDLKPVEVSQVPYLDGEYPHRVNQSQGGRPIRLGGRTYSRGIGVHARSQLTYQLDGGFKTFSATVGIDAEVGGQGSVVFRVIGDGKVLYESPVVRGSDAPLPIEVPVDRVLLLRLEVDFADNGDVADHADWADARLLRP